MLSNATQLPESFLTMKSIVKKLVELGDVKFGYKMQIRCMSKKIEHKSTVS